MARKKHAGPLIITAGAGVNRPQGQRVTFHDRDPVTALRHWLAGLPPETESWWSGHVWRDDYRCANSWEQCQVFAVDVDYHDASGQHAVLPEALAAQVVGYMESGWLPGTIFHLTPRGCRVVFVLDRPCLNSRTAQLALRGACEFVKMNLPSEFNLHVDTSASTDLARLFYAPAAIVDGVQRQAEIHIVHEFYLRDPRRPSVSDLKHVLYLRDRAQEEGKVEIVDFTADADAERRPTPAAPAPDHRPLPVHLEAMLAHIPADDYHTWIQVGMALKHEYGDAALPLWDRWSRTSSKYPWSDPDVPSSEQSTQDKWASFRRKSGNKVTLGSVVRLAQQGGWDPARSDHGPEVFAAEPATTAAALSDRDGEPILLRMSDVAPQKIDWLWQDRVATKRLSVIAGVPGAGKSYLTLDMAARVSTGAAWPDGSPCQRGSVVLVTCEDDPADTIRPRLDSCEADVGRVHVLAGVRRINPRTNKESETAFTLADLVPLDNALAQLEDVRLVMIDPIGSYFGGRQDSYKDTEVRSVLAPLAQLAAKHGIAAVLVAHTRKQSGGAADDAVLGSRGFTGLARAVHHVFRDPDSRARRLFLPGKMNTGKEAPGLAFRLAGNPIPAVVYETAPVAVTADEVAARLARRRGGNREPKGAALDWLRNVLGAGPLLAGDVQQLAKAAGLGWRTVQRASRDLEIEPRKDAFRGRWVWALPHGDDTDSLLA